MTPVLHDHASACAKVILLGEHSVVHGQPALAAGLPDALQLTASRLSDRSAPLEVAIPAWDLAFTLADVATHPVARACGDVIGHCDGPLTGWRIEGKTSIVARAGLGSSAAITVAMARLVLGEDAPFEAVIDASMVGERVFHGTPSGIDSEVAARGGLLRFVRGEAPQPLVLGRAVPLVIVPSGIPRNTGEQVAKVHHAIERWPTVARPIVETLGRIATLGQEQLERGDFARFGELANMAHALLGALGVSSPELDELCSIARANGALGAKLTGAGGGGCIIAIPNGSPDALVSVFRARGLSPLVVEVQA
jgi:mevalonate kinase